MPATIAAAALLGILTWSLLEYLIHRWLGHDRRLRPNLFANEHVRHHSEGNYFAPSWKKAVTAVIALLVLGGAAILLAGLALGAAYALGFVGFYLFYEVLHRLEHTWIGFGPYGRWARRHHFWHHFGEPNANFGVTSPVWDVVFGTYRRPGLIVVPEKLKSPWLTDPASGELRPELARHYRLRRARGGGLAARRAG